MIGHYLGLAPRYLAAHRKKTRLTITSVAIAVALVTGIFSMLEVFQQFSKTQIIHDRGNYHIAIIQPSEQEINMLAIRKDVNNAGRWLNFGQVKANEINSAASAIDPSFAKNMNITLVEGRYPTGDNEIMIEQWAADKLYLNTKLNGTVNIAFSDKIVRNFTVSGICKDFGNMKASGNPGIFMSMAAADKLKKSLLTSELYVIEFKNRVNIAAAEKNIAETLGIDKDRIDRNNRLLAAIGQNKGGAATQLYVTGGILFCIVLIAGVMMIYNAFNISVMERIRQFGLLRCIGASPAQIRKLVRREGLAITVRAIPIGVLTGMLLTLGCSAILKYYNASLFADIPLFTFSVIGIATGVAVGLLTVFSAVLLPARKAARVAPVRAVTGSNDLKISVRRKRGWLTKLFKAEIAMGICNVAAKKKTLILMVCSIAVSIVMFMGFQVFVDLLHSDRKTTKPYTPDISLVAKQGDLDGALYDKLQQLDGLKKVYGRMYGDVAASFDASKLSEAYKKEMGGVDVTADGRFVPPEKSWLISYDQAQLDWAKEELLEGELSEEQLNSLNGIIAVALHYRGRRADTTSLKLGDKVTIETSAGLKEMTVLGIVRSLPFSNKEKTLTSFITTEKLFRELTGKRAYQVIDIQLKKSGQEQAVNEIKAVLDSDTTFQDYRQRNAELDQTFFTMAVFIYGFVGVIGLISVLNIINTMNTSIAAKTKYLGVMRAVGMSGAQLSRMVLAEAAAYSLTGGIVGCLLGTALQKTLIESQLTRFQIIWEIPYLQIGLILLLVLAAAAVSVIAPLKRVKKQGIAEVIGSL
ncbi:ABC transporter permease [Paenibacillus sp. FSL M7-1046]|uniref:ABC transporter permease n=1 Tax=Paenibacillus sp. FSL M7-1046 TaxID=2975315 RepID=UPI0030F7C99B